MKKMILILLILLLLSYYCFPCKKEEVKKDEVRGVFVSYIEIEEYLKNKEEEESKKEIDQMISNVYDFGLNTIVLQVRPCSDAIYYSKIFPLSTYLTDFTYSYDVLSYFIDKCHEKDMKLIAWINPYRIQTVENLDLIKEGHPAYPYLGTDMIYMNGGVYYNPSYDEVTDLIVDGVLEVLEYPVDGVLFDDYFYPSDDIDIIEYEKYKENNDITMEEYHLMIINQMIQKVYQICHDKNISFGISPDGNIDNNYQKNYADVKRWMKEDNYIDFIMPQIYYGFYNQNKPFLDVSYEWESYLLNDRIHYYVALAFYKVGKEDYYAFSGKDEWIYNNNIMMREVIVSRNIHNYHGFVFFRYDNLFDQNQFTENSQMEVNHVKKLLK